MSRGTNPYILFLILVLLVLGFDPEVGRKIEIAKSVMDRMMVAMNSINAGLQSVSTEFDEIQVMLKDVNMFGPEDK